MSDLIRRSDAIKVLKDSVVEMGGDDFCEMGVHIDDIEAVVNAIPSADRPQGEWIAVSCFDAFGGDESAWMAHGNPTAFHYCSECKEQTRIDEFGEKILSNYCPHCGARMKGADNDN